MEDEGTLKTSFDLYQRHLDFLDRINSNSRSHALRTHLDSIIRVNRKIKAKQTIDNILILVILGVILLFLAGFSSQYHIIILLTAFGAGIMTYGLIGGIIIGFTKNKTK